MSLGEIRRKDRAINDETWIKDYLEHSPFGVLATEHEGQPYVNSNLFVYDDSTNAIYLHTAREGRTATNVRLNERVCFTVAEMGRLLPRKKDLLQKKLPPLQLADWKGFVQLVL